MTVASHDAKLGVTLGGKYKIVRLLGEGGMGAVFEALHVVVKRRFAVKFLRSALTQRRDALQRFQREAAAAGALESENIAAVVDFGIADEGSPYIVMEYLAGCDLAAALRSTGPLPFERATDIVLQACLGIHQAHVAGVIHRDLKPENLFLCRRSDGSDLVKIVDFGIAKLQASDMSAAVTSTGGVVGTPSYMSPEQARGGASIDPRTDVYALGVILYELLSGQTPHPGDSYNAVIYHISTQPPLALCCQDRELPDELVDVVQRAIAHDPEERPTSADELAKQLSRFAKREVWPACASNTERAASGSSSNTADQSKSGSPVSKSDYTQQSKRTRQPWIVAGVSLVALLLAGGYVMKSRSWQANAENLGATPMATRTVEHPLPVTSGAASVDAPAPSSLPIHSPASTDDRAEPSMAMPSNGGTTQASLGIDGKRPIVTPGRPPGRPAPAHPSALESAAVKSAIPSSAQAKFDPSNPYE